MRTHADSHTHTCTHTHTHTHAHTQLYVLVDVIQLEVTATALDNAGITTKRMHENIHAVMLLYYIRCNSGWSGENCDTCVPRQGCCKLTPIQ